MKVLYISSFLPKRNASQAGVNITYNIIRTLRENINCDVDLLCTLNSDEYGKDDSDIKIITEDQYYIEVSKKKKIVNIFKNILKPIIASVRFDKRVISLLEKIDKKYDYIIIDYTQNISYIDFLRKRFPTSKISIIEHDVSFLGLERRVNQAKFLKKALYKFEYKRLRKYELSQLKKFDRIYTLNEKDKNLISELKNVDILSPFINKWNFKYKEHDTFNIMYWGAMNRKENEIAVLNFVNDIWPSINKENVKFYIIGANPTKRIMDLQNDNIIVTGFVDDPSEYFSIIDLSIVPLTLGAGIKIKVLESLANGIPVLTTSIGAEGINYKDEFIVTDSFEEFADKINLLNENKEMRIYMSEKSLKLINHQFGFKGNEQILRKFIK
ncbi:group 1 glycosyl transferase [Clostridium sartagoforme AAU1]|uniref:Group 1 glycosyl transferase n=1 Tax=Clostridium sartagoforme AAU1 TaxID=1202534 RepID=R9C5B1_9CLOT|nr:glycosyltransferase [Clostridium sartagoforme]EOR24559.1 group 1 glycosyl transferase [Clostridium sartagoforme AAU1]